MSITKKITERASDELLIGANMLIEHGFITELDDLMHFFEKPYKWFGELEEIEDEMRRV